MRLGVLASGSGTILEAILESGLPVAVVVADRPCRALDIATEHGVAAVLVARTDYGAGFDRDAYSAEVASALATHGVDAVAMAGFGTVLGRAVFDAYSGRILNTHPSLLPAFKGWHAVADALAAGVAETGCTVHVATLSVDDGPILAQERVALQAGDTVETLHERIKSVERRLYPATIGAFLDALERGAPDPVGAVAAAARPGV